MKITRLKHVKKNLAFYKKNFGFQPPYLVLVDGTFCQAALENKVQIKEQLPKYLMGDVLLCTTRCVINELESLGKELFGAKIIAQKFKTRPCAHSKTPICGSECLLSMIGANNPHRYIIASQDRLLTSKLTKIPGVPLMFIMQNTMILDKPSPKSVYHVKAQQDRDLFPEHQKQNIEHLKNEHGVLETTDGKVRKRKRISGPNPLSCLKKKKKNDPKPTTPASEQKNKRKRKRKKPSLNPTTESA